MSIAVAPRQSWFKGLSIGQALGWTMPIWAVLISFLAGSIVIILAGADPIKAYAALIQGAVGNQGSIATTLV